MFKSFGKFKNFLILLLVFSFVFSFVGVVFGETVTKDIKTIREEIEEIERIKISEIYSFGEYWTYYGILYVEPEGICVFLDSRYKDKITITEEHLNKFFASLWKVFGLTRFPDAISLNFFVSIFSDHSLIVRFPMGAFYDYYKREKISREDFLKQCEIWIDGEKAVIEGETVKALGKEFKMDFEF